MKRKPSKSKDWKLVEKDDHLAVHGLFGSQSTAETHLREVIPIYVAKGYFTNKTLTKDSFEILPPEN